MAGLTGSRRLGGGTSHEQGLREMGKRLKLGSPMRRSFGGIVFNKRSNGMSKIEANRIAREVRIDPRCQARVVKGSHRDAGRWVVYTKC